MPTLPAKWPITLSPWCNTSAAIWALFVRRGERAVALNPRCSYTMAWVGRLFCYSGDWERGIQLTTRAIQLGLRQSGSVWLWHVLQ